MLFEEWDMEDAKEVWQEEARKEGLAKGHEEASWEKLQIAANLLKLGVSVDIITQATGISVEEIEAK